MSTTLFTVPAPLFALVLLVMGAFALFAIFSIIPSLWRDGVILAADDVLWDLQERKIQGEVVDEERLELVRWFSAVPKLASLESVMSFRVSRRRLGHEPVRSAVSRGDVSRPVPEGWDDLVDAQARLILVDLPFGVVLYPLLLVPFVRERLRRVAREHLVLDRVLQVWARSQAAGDPLTLTYAPGVSAHRGDA